MKGFILKTVVGVALLSPLVGCACYRSIVDPCWPERYNAQARGSVNEAFAAQSYNGHVLDQTIWNYQFEKGTDHLNPAGVVQLQYLARRRPYPDARLFLQTANDLYYDGDGAPEQAIQARNDLNNRRIAAIQKALAVQTNGHGVFTVEIHDPAPVGLPAVPIIGNAPLIVPGGAYGKLEANFQGVLPAESGTSAGAGIGSASSSGAGGR
jgi:hypothetical protein